MKRQNGKITMVNGNMAVAEFAGDVIQNEVAYILSRGRRLKSEIIKIKNNNVFLQVFEYPRGIKVGDEVEFSGKMLSVELGPGLLTQIYDGLQNPLPKLAEKFGGFLPVGEEIPALCTDTEWEYTPYAKKGDIITGGMVLGTVPEGIFKHKIMVPFYLTEEYEVIETISPGKYTIDKKIAVLKSSKGGVFDVTMVFEWPVTLPVKLYKRKLRPKEPLVTKIRVIDTLFPVAKGGTYCIPGPFGAGKTVLQQITARYAEIDIVIIAACGERAGEVVETLKEFPKLQDPRTGRILMERTIIICNTSSMPVAAREASVYTAATLAEYYRQMGFNILLLADSTSRWAQAMREISGRLEEIPGEEAYPAYLESRIAGFYERAGTVELFDGGIGSLTIGGTVSPAGGNFEEPVTQGTLKVVGAFHGLSRDRAEARKYPAVDPLESWSKYEGVIEEEKVAIAKGILSKGEDTYQMMKVVGEEGVSIEDFVIYLKSSFFDDVYLQQNAFDKVDAATIEERQKYVFEKILWILKQEMNFKDKEEAREYFYNLRHKFIDWNYKEWATQEFEEQEGKIDKFITNAQNLTYVRF